MRRAFSILCWLGLGAAAALVVLELVLHFLPVATGMRRTDEAARWPLQDTPPRSAYSYSTTWAMLNSHRGLTNNYGHVAPFDYLAGSQPVIVVGDSFVESQMNDYADTLQGQLGRRMGQAEAVYGLGVSGLSASDYVPLSRQARDEFKPRAAVFVISDGDLSESLIRRPGTYFLVPQGDGWALDYLPSEPHGKGLAATLRQAAADLAIHRYFQVNLQFSLDKVLAIFGNAGADDSRGQPSIVSLDAQRRIADWFLQQLPANLGLPTQCVALLVDTDRYAIYRSDLASTPKDLPAARDYLLRRAKELGFAVSDLDPVFRQRFAHDRIKFDYFPIDRHWNKVGHGVAAQEAYRLLTSGPSGGPPACLSGTIRGDS